MVQNIRSLWGIHSHGIMAAESGFVMLGRAISATIWQPRKEDSEHIITQTEERRKVPSDSYIRPICMHALMPCLDKQNETSPINVKSLTRNWVKSSAAVIKRHIWSFLARHICKAHLELCSAKYIIQPEVEAVSIGSSRAAWSNYINTHAFSLWYLPLKPIQ